MFANVKCTTDLVPRTYVPRLWSSHIVRTTDLSIMMLQLFANFRNQTAKPSFCIVVAYLLNNIIRVVGEFKSSVKLLSGGLYYRSSEISVCTGVQTKVVNSRESLSWGCGLLQIRVRVAVSVLRYPRTMGFIYPLVAQSLENQKIMISDSQHRKEVGGFQNPYN